jgi:release factor glutamine methyltransferase
MTTYTGIKDEFQMVLKKIYSSREIDAIFYVLINFIKKWTKVDYTLNKNKVTSNEDVQFLMNSLNKLAKGLPVQHITNRVYFYDMNLFVNENVLVPRPETEELVHWVHTQNKIKHPASIVDIGTGSGCIILALKKLFSKSSCVAVDNSSKALDVARENALRLNLDILFFCTDILTEDFPIDSCDIIVSNPPYIPFSQMDSMPRNVVEYEPHQALFIKDETPLIFYDKIAKIGKKVLVPNGEIYFEIHEEFGDQVVHLLKSLGYKNCNLGKDLQGKARFVSAIN